MIKSWQHKGLKLFYETGSTQSIQAKHQTRLKIILQHLDAAINADDLNLPGMNWHPLKGNKKGYYAVSVSGNWRIIYQFDGRHTYLVDYIDYH